MNNLKQMKQELEETKNKCTEIEKKIEELEKQESKVRWRADVGGKYYCAYSAGIVDWHYDIRDESSTNRYDLGNYFRTEEEAKKMVEKIKIYTQLKDLALRLNKGRTIRWNDFKQPKYRINRDVESNELFGTSVYCYQDIGQIYCLDSDFLNIAKQEISEENLRKLFE